MVNILVIDDDQENLVTVCTLLKNSISKCKISISNIEDIDLIKNENIDLIILNDFELYKTLKKYNKIPIVILVKNNSELSLKKLNSNIDSFLIKPYHEITFKTHITSILQIKKLNDLLYKKEINNQEKNKHLNDILLESIPAPAMIIDNDRKILACNKAALKVGAMIDSFCWESFGHCAFIQNENTPHPKCTFCQADGALKGRKQVNMEITAWGKIWDVYWIPIDDNLYLHYLYDITKHKKFEKKILESEEKFRSLFMESKDAIIISCKLGKIIDINESGLNLFGYKKEDIENITAYDFYPNPNEREIFLEKMEEDGFVKDYETKFLRKDGIELSCILSSVGKKKNGKLYELRSIIRDITKEKILQQKLIHSEKLSSIGTFVSGVAHELNNPLNIIMGFVQNLLIEDLPNEHIKTLKIIDKATMRTIDVVKNLLKFSRRYQPGKETTSINHVIEDAFCLQEFYMNSNNIRVIKEYSDDIIQVNIDISQIQQVIMNLINNAIYAMKFEDTKIFKIKTRVINNEAILSFTNRGNIPIENIDKLFNPFFTTKKIGEGTGLGLYISKEIIQEHDGKIFVENIEEGIKFTIILPLSEIEIKKPEDNFSFEKLNNIRILYIEDEYPLRIWINKALTNFDAIVSTTSDALSAKEILKNKDFDIIICDIKMKGVDGIEFGKWLNKNKPFYKDKFILVTGAIDPDIENYCRENNSVCIMKPFTIKKLISEIYKKVDV